MTFVHQQAPLLNSLVCLLCGMDKAALLDVLNDQLHCSFDNEEPNEAILMQFVMPKKAKIHHIQTLSLCGREESNRIIFRLGERIILLFKLNSPLEKFLATRLECLKGLL